MTVVNDRSAITKPQRRRLRFGLKSVLGIVFVVALALATIAVRIKQREIETLEQQGHGFFRITLDAHRRGASQVLVGRWAITIPRHRYILVHSDSGLAAFKLTDNVSTGDGGVKYRWFFRPDLNGDFTQPGVVSGESSVYEKYVPVPGGGENEVMDAGGRTWIQCGPIRLEWSSGNHVYLPGDEEMEIAYTDKIDIAGVKPDDPLLIWSGCKHQAADSEQPHSPKIRRGRIGVRS